MDQAQSIILDFDKICRICLHISENMRPIFSTDAPTYISNLVLITVEIHDGLPQNICDTCLSKLHEMQIFKNQIMKTYEILQNHVLQFINPSIKKEVEEEVEQKNVDTQQTLHIKNYYSIPTKLPHKELRGGAIRNPEMAKAIAEIKASAPLENKTLCHLCNKNFSCVAQLTRHLKTHTGIRTHVCNICGKAYMESGSLRKHILSKHSGREKPYTCAQCNQGFDRRSVLVRHVRTHTGEKPFRCEICMKSYPCKSYLNEHRKIHLSTRGKTFICEICSKSFALKDSLKTHLITHSNVKPFPCTMCDKAFTNKRSLISHIKHIHTKEKDFMCQMCGKTFVTKHELDEHIKRHTGEKREPRYLCLTCNKKLSSPSHLKLHIRASHTGERPYACDCCSKAFITREALKVHKRSHTGEKPYSCNYCSKKFITSQVLKVHSRIHTGEKPYVCSMCNMSFNQNGSLKTHFKVHTR